MSRKFIKYEILSCHECPMLICILQVMKAVKAGMKEYEMER